MKLLEFARGAGFWLLDSLKGGVVSKELATMRKINNGTIDEIREYQKSKINKLLKNAVDTVEYYKKCDSESIKGFPVITKAILKDNYDAFISNRFDRDKLFKMTTSGSTGTPFTSLQDVTKKKSVYAEVLYYNGEIGYSIGRKIIYLRSIVSENSKSDFQQFAQNIYLVDCYDLSDKGIENILDKIKKLTKNDEAMMMGYASTLDAFSSYFNRNGVKATIGCNLYGIVSGSEMLFDTTRDNLEKAFRCKCVSRYANEENGFLGQDGYRNNVFFTNPAHFYYEILKFDSDEEAEEDEVGRIVVTDLNNYAMPMIRYDTGDVGKLVYVSVNGKRKLAIDNFGGRKIDVIFNSTGRRISPHAVTNLMWKYTDIKQYQLIQKTQKEFLLKLNAKEFMRQEELEKDLVRVLGEDVILKVEYVDEIPVMLSGKRKYIVNEM